MEMSSSCDKIEEYKKNETIITPKLEPYGNPKFPTVRLDLKEVDKLFAIISQTDLEALTDVRASESNHRRCRFAPYPIHRQLFIQQQQEQERRRLSMTACKPKISSSEIYKNPSSGLNDKILFRTKVVKKVISFIDSYSVRMYSQQCDYNDKCAICMYNYQENEQLRQLLCKHKFHRKCVDEWLVKSYLCPICRTALVSSGKINRSLSDFACNLNQTTESEPVQNISSVSSHESGSSKGVSHEIENK